MRCCTQKDVQLQQVAAPAQIYFLERCLTRLQTISIDDYKRVYKQMASHKLKIEEKRRHLDHCRTRGMRWHHLHLSYSRILGDIRDSMRSESGSIRQTFVTCGDHLQQLLQQVEDQLQKTKEFVKLQLDHIEEDQQRQLMQNQIELSQVQIAESRKAIEQTETVRKLTILAFVFIPTSTICSFFGMNIRELDNHPRIWIFFATLTVVIGFVLVIAAADGVLDFIMRVFAALPALRRGGEPHISRTRHWIALILYRVVHIPFGLIWIASSKIAGRWRKLMSEGREYRTGYQDPDMAQREGHTGSTYLPPYIDKGLYVSSSLDDTFHSYRGRWMEFWHPPAKVGPNDPAMDPIPPS